MVAMICCSVTFAHVATRIEDSMAAKVAQQLRPDETIGDDYVIERHLGAGGMGEVYLARDARLERRVAVKLLLPGASADEASEARFVREAKTLSRVNHPNVVGIHAFGRHKGNWFIVMEYVDGQGMDVWLQESSKISLSDAVTVLHQIASGIAEAHAVGIIHRDIKPANVLLRPLASGARLAKVLDFGLARSVKVPSGGDISTPGALLGTPAYMAPEQIQGQELDGRSDLYSLAVVAFQLLSGKLPFYRDTMQGTLIAHLVDPIPELKLPGTDEATRAALERELHQALSKTPDERHSSILTFADALCAATGVRSGDRPGPVATCPCCGNDEAAPGGFCSRCGSPVPMDQCPICQTRRRGERFACLECGAPLVIASGRNACLEGRQGDRRGQMTTINDRSLVAATATVLVGRLMGGTLGPARLRETTSSFITAVEREGGRVLAVVGREMIAVFGLGGMREWETEAAIDAALAVHKTIEHNGNGEGGAHSLALGVAVGRLGTLGAGIGWGTALAGGEAVELGRRAAALAGDYEASGLCIGERGWREVKDAYVGERVDDRFRVIVRRKPVAFLDHGKDDSPTPLIGREVELAQLRRACRRVVRQSRTAVVPISGAAGVGKSRLIGEFLSRLEGDPGTTWHFDLARCTPVGVPVPYEPFVHLLRRRIGADEAQLSGEELRERLCNLPGLAAGVVPQHVIERRVAALARVLGSMDGAALDEPPRPANEAERQAAFEAVAAYVRGAASKGPALIVIEDLDRARTETMALLEHLVHSLNEAPVLFVLSMRESRTEELLSQLHLTVTQATLIEVPTLEHEECAELMTALLDGFEPPDELVETVHRFSEGLPMRVEEALGAFVGDGVFERGASGWQLGSVSDANRSLDRSMTELVMERVGRLAPGEQQVLLALALAGHDSPGSMLGAMLQRDVTEGQITALRRSGFVRLARGHFGSELELTLRNPQVGEILQGSVQAKTVAEWHQSAARWMTAWTGPRPPDFGALIAQHFLAADDLEKSTRSLLDAAHNALLAFSNRDAFDILQAAATVGRRWLAAEEEGTTPRQILGEVLISVAEVGHRVSELDIALAAAGEALEVTDLRVVPVLRPLHARAICARGDLLETQGRYQDAIDDFASAAELLDEVDEAAAQAAHARSRQAMVLHKSGQLASAETIATAALQRWAGRTEPALLRAYGRLEQALGHVAAHSRDFERAAHHYQAAITWVERAGDLIGVAMATVSLGNLAFRARDLNKAESLYRDAVRQFRSLDLATGRAMAQTNLGNVLLEQGRFVEALKQLNGAEAVVRKAGSADMLPEVLRLVAACSLALGDVSRAGGFASEAVERAQGLGNEAMLAAARTTFRKVKQASQVIERITVSDDGLSAVLHEGDDTMPYVRGPAPTDAKALKHD